MHRRQRWKTTSWRREMLEQQRAKVQEEIANRRLELSHLEEHIRELEQKWDALRQQATDLQRSLLGETRDRDAAETQLRQLQQQVSEAKQALDDARQEAAQRQPVYAIVPYDGPNGTHRRPIYLECTADGVVIQPEGIVLGWSDFEGPLGPGNPLDAALRAFVNISLGSVHLARKANPIRCSWSGPREWRATVWRGCDSFLG